MTGAARGSAPGDAVSAKIGEEWPPFLILASLTLLFLAQTPGVAPLAQMVCILAGVVGFAATIAACRGFAENMARAITRAPTLLLLLLTAWATYKCFTSPAPYRLLAAGDLLRVYGGTLAYIACAYCLPTLRQGARLVVGITVIAVFVAFSDFSSFSANASKYNEFFRQTSVLGSHMTIGGFLAALVAVVAAFAFAPGLEDRARLVAQLSFVVLAFALVLSRSRSGWIAGVAALIVVATLFARNALRERWRRGVDPQGTRPRRNDPLVLRVLNSPFLFVGLGLIALIFFGGVGGKLGDRTQQLRDVASGKLTRDTDFTLLSRVHTWRGALLMMREKPLMGMGLGGFVVEQGRWTHGGDEAIEVLHSGAGHQNRAHNFYLQWGVDTGFVGLFLYIAFLSAWAFTLLRGIPVAPSPERRALAIGAAGAMIAGAIDGFASPMYQMHGTYALMLAWMGLGLGALRADPPRHGLSLAGRGELPPDDQPAIRDATPVWDWLGAAAVAALACYLCVYLGKRIIADGSRQPPGALRVETIPATWEVRPGTRVVFKAIFTDGHGVVQPTLPGTVWRFDGSADLLSAPGAGFVRLDAPRMPAFYSETQIPKSGFVIVPPPGAQDGAVTATALYRDDWGRMYHYSYTMAVRADAPVTLSAAVPGDKGGAGAAPARKPAR